MNNIHIAALQMVPGIGNVRLKTLIRYFGSAEEAWKADRRDLSLCGCLDETLCNALLHLRNVLDLAALALNWEKQGIRTCSCEEAAYPRLLHNTFNPPVLLYYRGTLPNTDNNIAIVGSRHASAYGKNVANMLGSDLASAGVWVISGAARGIDTAAHQGALKQGCTLAVLGCGVDVVYPPENSHLLASIVDQGAVISEYPPGTPPHAGYFPARNRIINGLSRGVVVVEAAERSGALITADFALEEGRDVFAVPGSIFSLSSKGTHRLIQQGAKLVTTAQDIIEEYGISSQAVAREPVLTEEEMAIFKYLSYDVPVTVEYLVTEASLPLPSVTFLLLQMELRGLVIEQGQRYIRSAEEGIL